MQLYYYISLPYAVSAIKILCIIIAELCSCYYFYRRHHHRRQYYCAFVCHTCPTTFDYNLPKIIFVLETIHNLRANLNRYIFTTMQVIAEKKIRH